VHRRSLCSGALYPGALVPCHQAEQLPVHRRVGSPKFFSLFAHWGGDRQRSVVELPVAGEGASLLSIGALVLKGAFLFLLSDLIRRSAPSGAGAYSRSGGGMKRVLPAQVEEGLQFAGIALPPLVC
jgi:hypothetical protein